MLSRFPWFTRWPDRKLEWTLALYTVWFGLWLLMPWQAMNTRSFDSVLTWAREPLWGLLFLFIGVCHNVALHVNGRAWWTPLVRTVALLMNATAFLVMDLGLAAENPGGTGVGTYTYFVFGFCGAALWTASYDVGHEWTIWRSRANGGD